MEKKRENFIFMNEANSTVLNGFTNGITITDLRDAVKGLAIDGFGIVRVSNEWAVLLRNGKPESAIEWNKIERATT